MSVIGRVRTYGGTWDLGLFTLILAAYLATLSSSVGHEDSGELAAAAYGLGIAHPPGYPLFTLLGRVFSLLPLEARVIWKLNLLSAVLCAVAATLFFRLFLLALSRVSSRPSAPPGGDALLNRVAAAGAALLLAFSPNYWAAAVEVEVHGLHLVLLAAALLLNLSAVAAWEADRPFMARRLWLLFAYVFGLGLTNHMTLLLTAPAVLHLHFSTFGAGAAAWRRLLAAGAPILLALSAYLYLPLRALRNPAMNWGNPADAEGLVWHLTAEQFRGHIFSSGETAFRKLGEIVADFPDVLGPLPLLGAAAGAFLLAGRDRRLFAYTALIFAACVGYAANHDFEDPSYRLNAHVALALWAAVGIRWACALAGRRAVLVAVPLCALLAGLLFARNFPAADKRNDHVVEDYARNVLASADSGALVLSGEYRRLVAPAYYLQLVEGYRADVAVLSISLVETPWYLNQFGTRHPEVLGAARGEAAAFLGSLRAALRGERGAVAGGYLGNLIRFERAVIHNNLPARNVYVTTALHATAPDASRIPVGMLFRIPGPRDAAAPPEVRRFLFHPFPAASSSPLARGIRQEYADAYVNMAGRLVFAHGDTLAGMAMLREALGIQPGFAVARQFLRELEGRRPASP